MDQIFQWVEQYGDMALFVLLVAGIVGLPIPDETLLAFAGSLIWKGTLSAAPTLLAAFGGSCCGITISYVLGRTLGIAALHKFGRFLHVDAAKIERLHNWFEHRGHWTLTFGYYVPCVRHVTAIMAGTGRMRLGHFMVFAYGGALIWSASWILLGFLLGTQWRHVSHLIHHHLRVATLIAIALILVFILVKKWLARRQQARRENGQ